MSGAADIDMLSCAAHFDGSGAGVDFFPAIQVLDEAGQVAATVVGSKVTAGDSADVTFAPFLETEAAGGGADPLAVHYDTSPQTADFLESTTANNTTIENSGPGQINISSDDGAGGGGFVSITTADGEVFTGSSDIVERISNTGTYEVQNHSGTTIVRVNGDGSIELRLTNASELNVYGPFSRPIMKLTDGGGGIPTYQGKTGGAWVFNL